MTRRRQQRSNWGFNLATVVQVFAIPVLTGVVYLFAQWVTTGDTLKRHDTEILQNQVDIKKEGEERQKNRSEFLDKLGKLNDGISTLNTNLAVQGQVLTTIKEELTKRK